MTCYLAETKKITIMDKDQMKEVYEEFNDLVNMTARR